MIFTIFFFFFIINVSNYKYLFFGNYMLCVKKQNKVCCIVLYYCKLEQNYLIFFINKNDKILLKGQGQKSMINDAST